VARGVTQPEWSPDGRLLVAAGPTVGPLRLLGFPGGAVRELAGSGSPASSSAAPSWQPLRPRR
jgi:hypothetical protein